MGNKYRININLYRVMFLNVYRDYLHIIYMVNKTPFRWISSSKDQVLPQKMPIPSYHIPLLYIYIYICIYMYIYVCIYIYK